MLTNSYILRNWSRKKNPTKEGNNTKRRKWMTSVCSNKYFGNTLEWLYDSWLKYIETYLLKKTLRTQLHTFTVWIYHIIIYVPNKEMSFQLPIIDCRKVVSRSSLPSCISNSTSMSVNHSPCAISISAISKMDMWDTLSKKDEMTKLL